ncbi:MAG: hypothetical protein KDE58_42960, partial [Caldilineaceae bacterium]|nr:hypothetical protein [Caldilineaceae bacterium]
VTVYPLPALDERRETGGSLIGRLLFDHRGHLWLSLLGTDVFEFNPETETFTAYALISGPPEAGPPANVNAMVEDEQHNLWFAVSFTGLYRLDAARQELSAIRYRGRPDFFTNRPDNIASAAVVALTSDGQGTLWIGYHDGTISRFVPAENSFTHYPSRGVLSSGPRPPRAGAPPCQECPAPPNGRPPAAQASSPPTGTVSSRLLSPEEIAAANPSGWIEALYWDSATNLLWIGERNGLVRFDPATDAFTHYGAEAGLANTFIVSIAQDQQGALWLGTQHGLIYFDPVQERGHSYTVANGLQNNQFNRLAALRRTDGRLFFGGTTGLTSFDPVRVVNPINPIHEVP